MTKNKQHEILFISSIISGFYNCIEFWKLRVFPLYALQSKNIRVNTEIAGLTQIHADLYTC